METIQNSNNNNHEDAYKLIDNTELALKILTEKDSYVFEGGGILGISHIGALIRLYELGGLNTINYLVGTSVGSIISMALACGATSYYIKDKIFNLDLESFKDGGNWIVRIFRFLFRFGHHKGKQIELYAQEILKDLTGNGNITFSEAYKKFGTRLTITYLSTRYKKTKYADYITEPDLMIKKAVRWSSGIPLFYKPARRYGPRRLHGCCTRRELLDLIVDGGVADNYPLHVLREQGRDPANILGFKLCNSENANRYNANRSNDKNDEDIDHGIPGNVVNFGFRLVEILREQALRYHVHKEDWKLTCKIDVGKYQTTDFNIVKEDKMWLYNSGREAMDKHLAEIKTLLDKGEYPLGDIL